MYPKTANRVHIRTLMYPKMANRVHIRTLMYPKTANRVHISENFSYGNLLTSSKRHIIKVTLLGLFFQKVYKVIVGQHMVYMINKMQINRLLQVYAIITMKAPHMLPHMLPHMSKI